VFGGVIRWAASPHLSSDLYSFGSIPELWSVPYLALFQKFDRRRDHAIAGDSLLLFISPGFIEAKIAVGLRLPGDGVPVREQQFEAGGVEMVIAPYVN
jgi:hypothetical protein